MSGRCREARAVRFWPSIAVLAAARFFIFHALQKSPLPAPVGAQAAGRRRPIRDVCFNVSRDRRIICVRAVGCRRVEVPATDARPDAARSAFHNTLLQSRRSACVDRRWLHGRVRAGDRASARAAALTDFGMGSAAGQPVADLDGRPRAGQFVICATCSACLNIASSACSISLGAFAV